jgi:Protein kinase domain
MQPESGYFPATDAGRLNDLHRTWQELCARYLPVAPAGSVWRYNRERDPQDPEQGWKLHLPATVLNAATLLETVAAPLVGRGVQFKAPASLQELSRINCGLQHGYSQVGKCVTVYPRTTDEALALADELHELTYGIPAPAVPFDLRFRPDSNVYYRYGAFRRLTIEQSDGTSILALRDPQGNLIPDLRAGAAAQPAWVQNPFPTHSNRQYTDENPLKTTYRAFRALAQRGKGGVYQAFDLSVQPARFCLLKEGRGHGELGWDGRDGRWRVRHEEQVLATLQASGMCVPRVYGSFEMAGNYYLVTEFIEGESLQRLLDRRRRRLPVSVALRYGSEIAAILSGIHSAGWVWRDCKPSNFIMATHGIIRPIDFEGACPIEQPDPLPWGTPAFAPPASRSEHEARSSIFDDLYSLGAVIYLLLTGRLPEQTAPVPLQKLRREVPAEARELITELLLAPPRQRPGAGLIARRLAADSAGLRPSGAEG